MSKLAAQERDAYRRALEMDPADLAMALVMADMRLDGSWPRGRPAVRGGERAVLKARQRGLQRAWDERGCGR